MHFKVKLLSVVCGYFLKRIVRKGRKRNRKLYRHNNQYYLPLSTSELTFFARAYTLSLLNFFAPININEKRIPQLGFLKGAIICFNHPSLGEILRIIGTCFCQYPEKNILFPMNLTWYQAIEPYQEELSILGIEAVPIVTESTIRQNQSQNLSGNTTSYLKQYLASAASTLREGGIVVVAPSATRQDTIFQSKEQFLRGIKVKPTVSLLISKVASLADNFMLVPVLVEKPKAGNKGLNLFKKYHLRFCEPFSYEYLLEKVQSKKVRDLDYEVLQRLVENCFDENLYYPCT